MTKQRYADQKKPRRIRSATSVANGANGFPHKIHDKLKVDFTEDAWHCYETPYCQLLCELAQDIIPIKELQVKDLNLTKGSALLDSGLAALIRSYLIDYRRQPEPQQEKEKETIEDSQDFDKVTTNSVFRSGSQLHENVINLNPSTYDDLTSLNNFIDEKLLPLATTDAASVQHTFLSFLNDLLDSQTQNILHKKNSKKTQFLSQDGPHINFSQVQAAVESIACPTCRGAVRKVFMTEFCLQVYCPDGNAVNSTDAANSFDYMAMEEGVAPDSFYDSVSRQQLVFQTVNQRSVDYVKGNKLEPTAGWHLRRQCSSNPQRPKSSWIANDIEFMVTQYILMAGLHPDAITGAFKLQDDMVASINSDTDQQVSKIGQRFRDLSTSLSSQVEDFVQFHDSNLVPIDGFHIDTRITQIVAETDSFCCEVIKRVLELVFDVSHKMRYILAHHATASKSRENVVEECRWGIQPCNDVVKAFWDGVAGCYEFGFTFDQELVALGDRLGNTPAMYLSSRTRTLFRTAVEGKIRAVHHMIHSIELTLNQRVDVGGHGCENLHTSFIRKLVTTELFCTEVRKQRGEQHDIALCPTNSDLDHFAVEIFMNVATSWPKSVPAGNVARIYEARQAKYEELLIGVRRLNNFCKKNEIPGSCGKVTAIAIDMNNQLSQISSSLMEEQFDFPHHITQLFSAWIELKSNPQLNMIDLPISSNMPMKVKHTMVMFHDSCPSSLPQSLSCEGKSGRKRAVGLLVGLFFKGWLLDRFKEWHARRVEEELLGSLVADITRISHADSGKVSICTKKTKKKRKKVPGTQMKACDDAAQHDMGSNSNMAEKLDQLASCEHGESAARSPQETNSTVQLSCEEVSSIIACKDVGCYHSCDETGHQPISCETTVHGYSVEGDAFDETIVESSFICFQCLDEQDDENDANPTIQEVFTYKDVEAHLKVFVHSTGGFQSAESYLLHRFITASDEVFRKEM